MSGPCPCGTGTAYEACCEPLHRGAIAPDAEALMRSRYSAYVLGLEPYLLDTWHISMRPPSLNLSADRQRMKWLGLSVRRHEENDETHAVVEFVARYKTGGRAQRLHEVSEFVREGGRWYYVAARPNT